MRPTGPIISTPNRSAQPSSEGQIDSFRVDKLNVYVFSSRLKTLTTAAEEVGLEIQRLISERGRAIGVFASVPSQAEFFDELVKHKVIEWTRVIGFQLDEYLGANKEAPQPLSRFLIERLVKRVPMAEFHELRGEAANPEAVCANYAALLKSRPPDFATLDLGDDGSLASIQPSVCDFNDQAMLRVVELDNASRRAISLTIPTIMTCPKLFLIAPENSKAEAARKTIEGEITEDCPASILRRHEDAHLYLDQNSAARLTR